MINGFEHPYLVAEYLLGPRKTNKTTLNLYETTSKPQRLVPPRAGLKATLFILDRVRTQERATIEQGEQSVTPESGQTLPVNVADVGAGLRPAVCGIAPYGCSHALTPPPASQPPADRNGRLGTPTIQAWGRRQWAPAITATAKRAGS